jgi:hypothetical protein
MLLWLMIRFNFVAMHMLIDSSLAVAGVAQHSWQPLLRLPRGQCHLS